MHDITRLKRGKLTTVSANIRASVYISGLKLGSQWDNNIRVLSEQTFVMSDIDFVSGEVFMWVKQFPLWPGIYRTSGKRLGLNIGLHCFDKVLVIFFNELQMTRI